MTRSELASYFDHSLLNPDATAAQVRQVCEEALLHGLLAVCVAPAWVPFAHKILDKTEVHLATVAGFPHGDTLSSAKAHEAHAALDAGANEVEMVIFIGAAKDGDFRAVEHDIHAVVKAAHGGAIIKVILETAFLTESEKIGCCRAAQNAGADYVQTSTGFAASGATVEDVRLMRRNVEDSIGVKAAGGIRDLATALAMIEAGATRLGCAMPLAILDECGKALGSLSPD